MDIEPLTRSMGRDFGESVVRPQTGRVDRRSLSDGWGRREERQSHITVGVPLKDNTNGETDGHLVVVDGGNGRNSFGGVGGRNTDGTEVGRAWAHDGQRRWTTPSNP